MRLDHLGPEQGSYSAGQVIALFADFLREGSVRSFDIPLRSAGEQANYALVLGRAKVIDRQGRSAEIDLHLTFVPEDGRWILREIRETQP